MAETRRSQKGGGNAHTRAVAKALQSVAAKSSSQPTLVAPPTRAVQWYQSTMLWGAGSLAAAIIITVVAAMTRDLRWLLIFAWTFAALAAWEFIGYFSKSKVRRNLITTLAAAVFAVALYGLNIRLRPPLQSKLVADTPKPPETVQVPPILPTIIPSKPPSTNKRFSPPSAIARSLSPLEIVAFNSRHDIEISNNGNRSIFVVDLLLEVSTPKASKSYGLGFEIAPGKVHKEPIKEIFHQDVLSVDKLADTWKEHYEKALSLYQACGLDLVYYAQSDPSFRQMVDFYSKNGGSITFDDVSGFLHYRVQGEAETKTQRVPIVVTTMKAASCSR